MAGVELDIAELHHRPGDVLGHGRVGGEREAVRLDRGGGLADQFARVRDARVRSDPRSEHGHVVVGGKGLPVPAKVEERVAECAIRGSVEPVEPDRAASLRETCREAVLCVEQ